MPTAKRRSLSASKDDALPSSDKRPKIVGEKEEKYEEASVAPDMAFPAKSSDEKCDTAKVNDEENDADENQFIEEPVPADEARHHRPPQYLQKNKGGKSESLETQKEVEPPKELMEAKRHFTESLINGLVSLNLGGDVYAQVGHEFDNTASSDAHSNFDLNNKEDKTEPEEPRHPIDHIMDQLAELTSIYDQHLEFEEKAIRVKKERHQSRCRFEYFKILTTKIDHLSGFALEAALAIQKNTSKRCGCE